MQSAKDSLYANPLGEVASFKFDDSVANVFPDMIQRSVPGYSAMISAIGLLAARFCQDNSQCYDLGCSLGAATLAMRECIAAEHCQIIAVDNSEAMVSRFRGKLITDASKPRVDIQCADFVLSISSEHRLLC